jgi:hypothetical protein
MPSYSRKTAIEPGLHSMNSGSALGAMAQKMSAFI